jgi:integrase
MSTKTVDWASFRKLFERHYAGQLSPSSQSNLKSTLNLVEAHVAPQTPRDVQRQLLGFAQHLRSGRKCSPESVDQHLSRLYRVLRWGAEHGYCDEPKVPKRVGKRKRYSCPGRPLTTAEYDRMLASAKIVQPHNPNPLTFLLKGLWESGLRISEALALTWTPSDLYVDTTGTRWMLRISARADKSGQERLLPLAPSFVQLLQSVPADERTGHVFTVTRQRQEAARLIRECAKKADVKVSEFPKVKYASAHDFRRSFASRWAMKVAPAVLQQLMRHESIATTMKHYVQLNALDIAEQLERVG